MTLRGGYQAANDTVLPGPNDPTQWTTTIRRVSGTIRILAISSVTNSVLENIGFTGGNGTGSGGGLSISGSQLTMAGCKIWNNAVNVINAYGGGIYSANSMLVISNCQIVYNQNNGGQYAFSYGGGLYIGESDVVLLNSLIATNTAYAYRWDPVLAGGGISMGGAGSRLLLRNCLIIRNNSICDDGSGTIRGDGIDINGGIATVVNCTIANNYGEGLRQASGTVTVTNSILWNNTGFDLTGTVSVAYSDIQKANSFWTNEVNGCISVDPLFVDTTYYHLQSRAGHYVGGYFSGGSWDLSTSNESPCIDAGDPTSSFIQEPNPNGRRINLGAYGNTPVASKKLTPTGSIFTIH